MCDKTNCNYDYSGNPCCDQYEPSNCIEQAVNDVWSVKQGQINGLVEQAETAAENSEASAKASAEGAAESKEFRDEAELAATTATDSMGTVIGVVNNLQDVADELNTAVAGIAVATWYYTAISDNQTVIPVPADKNEVGIQAIYINGVRQEPNRGFIFDKLARTITLAEGIPLGLEIAIIMGTYSDNPNDFAYTLASNNGASMVGFKQEGVGAVTRTAADKLRELVSVKDFGAVGDGVANDTSAIQAAIDYLWSNSGGEIYIPPGIYLAANVILRPGIRLRGAGAGDAPLTNKKRPATTLKIVASAAPGSAIIKGDPSISGSRFAGGGILDIAFVGSLSSVPERPPAGSLPAHDGVSFESLQDGTWMQQFVVQNCFFYGLRKGLHLGQGSGVVRMVPMWGNRFWNCETGLRVESGHPNFGVNEFRFCDVGCSSNGFIDVAFHGCKFNLNRIGLNGVLQRVALIGCMFWQNSELGVNLQGDNQVIGCLFRGPETFNPTAGSALIKITQRNNMVIGNRFQGDHAGPAIILSAESGSIQTANIISNNTVFINNGRFIETQNVGTQSGVQILGNAILISSIGDGAGGQIFYAPASSGVCGSLNISNNNFRCDTVNQTKPLIDVKTSSGTLGPLVANNHVFASAVDVSGVFDFSGGDAGSGRFMSNIMRTSVTGTFSGPVIVPGTLNGTVIKDNVKFATENSGTAKVVSGTTSIDVTHGLSVTPLISSITVTPTNNMNSASKFWVSNVTSTQFSINVDTDPGAGGATFVWNISSNRLI